MAVEYNEACAGEFQRPYGSLQDLAWRWGVLSADNIGKIYKKIRFGQTVFRLPRIYIHGRIMDDFQMEETLIDIVVESKGGLSKRRIGTKFMCFRELRLCRRLLTSTLSSFGLRTKVDMLISVVIGR